MKPIQLTLTFMSTESVQIPSLEERKILNSFLYRKYGGKLEIILQKARESEEAKKSLSEEELKILHVYETVMSVLEPPVW